MQVLPVGVSFLVCTYNSTDRLPETLACLARQEVSAEAPWEIILVDNASTDGTSATARAAWQQLGSPAPLYVLPEPRPGKQFALETALAQVQYRHTCIVDQTQERSAECSDLPS